MLKMRKETKMDTTELKNGLNVQVYKLSNNKNDLQYRVIVKESKMFGKILHDGMFLTEVGMKHFVKAATEVDYFKADLISLSVATVDEFHIEYEYKDVYYRDFLLALKNAKTLREKDIIFEEKGMYAYTGGCKGLMMKHKSNGVRCINYDFLSKIRYDEKEAPTMKSVEEEIKQGKKFSTDIIHLSYLEEVEDYNKEYGITKKELDDLLEDQINNVNYKDLDNVIVKIKHFIYRH